MHDFKVTRLLYLICTFQSDILDVNEIFKDLATLVNEQGETIGML